MAVARGYSKVAKAFTDYRNSLKQYGIFVNLDKTHFVYLLLLLSQPPIGYRHLIKITFSFKSNLLQI